MIDDATRSLWTFVGAIVVGITLTASILCDVMPQYAMIGICISTIMVLVDNIWPRPPFMPLSILVTNILLWPGVLVLAGRVAYHRIKSRPSPPAP